MLGEIKKLIDSRPFYKKMWPGRPGFIFYFLFFKHMVYGRNAPSWRMSNTITYSDSCLTPPRLCDDTWRMTRSKDNNMCTLYHFYVMEQKKPVKVRATGQGYGSLWVYFLKSYLWENCPPSFLPVLYSDTEFFIRTPYNLAPLVWDPTDDSHSRMSLILALGMGMIYHPAIRRVKLNIPNKVI